MTPSRFPRAVLGSGDRGLRARRRRDRGGSCRHFRGGEAGGSGRVTQSAICSAFFFIPVLIKGVCRRRFKGRQTIRTDRQRRVDASALRGPRGSPGGRRGGRGAGSQGSEWGLGHPCAQRQPSPSPRCSPRNIWWMKSCSLGPCPAAQWADWSGGVQSRYGPHPLSSSSHAAQDGQRL